MRRIGTGILLVFVLLGGLVGCGRPEPNKNKDLDRPKATANK